MNLLAESDNSFTQLHWSIVCFKSLIVIFKVNTENGICDVDGIWFVLVLIHAFIGEIWICISKRESKNGFH